MDELFKRSLAEDGMRQKEIARQMAQQMIQHRQQESGELDVVGSRSRESEKERSKKLDELLAGQDSSKSDFAQYLNKVDIIVKTGLSDLLANRGQIATDHMLDSMNSLDTIPVLAERPEVLDASEEMALALTDHNQGISKFYDDLRDKVNQYKAEKDITEQGFHDASDAADDGFAGMDDDNITDNDQSLLPAQDSTELQAFIDFKDIFVEHFKTKKHGLDEDDLSKDLNPRMQTFLNDYVEQNPPMLGAGAPVNDNFNTGHNANNRPIFGQGEAIGGNEDLEMMTRFFTKGTMMALIMMAFVEVKRAMEENMLGPTQEAFSTSSSVTHLSQFVAEVKGLPTKDDAGKEIEVYKTEIRDGKVYIVDPVELAEKPTTFDDYMKNLYAVNRGAELHKKDGGGSITIPLATKAAEGMIKFLRSSAQIFGANLDSFLPASYDQKNIAAADVVNIENAYKTLLGTKTNPKSFITGDGPDDGIIAKWFYKNDPHNAAQVVQVLNGPEYDLYKDSDTATNRFGAVRDGLSGNLSTVTAALNLAQNQQNASNTAFYGWMKSWEDNAIEIARKTG